MSRPQLVVEVGFVEDPFGAVVWTDVTQYVRGVSGSRGKAHVYDQMSAGKCTVVLDNRDARFDPVNTASPYYPHVLPMRPIRVRTVTVGGYDSGVWDDGVWDGDGGQEEGIFSGYVDAWQPTYPSSVDGQVALRATDGFKALNLGRVSGSFPQQTSGARVNAILDAIDWPADRRNIEVGETTVQAGDLDRARPLEHLQKVADSELGLIYMDRHGDVRFMSRHGLIGGVLDVDTYTFGDGTNFFRDPELSFDDDDLWNEVEVSSQGVLTQYAEDLDSQAKYGLRSLDRNALLLTSVEEQANHATFVLVGGAEPALRIDSIEPVGDRGDWGRILDRDLGSKILVTFDPPGPGDVISQPSFVEQVTWNLQPSGPWTFTWALVPMDRRADFWVAEDPFQGVAGVTTRAAY